MTVVKPTNVLPFAEIGRIGKGAGEEFDAKLAVAVLLSVPVIVVVRRW